MDFSFSEAQTAVADLARKIFKERLTPDVLKAVEAAPDRFHRELWRELATTGLLGTALPESAGGSGHGILELCSLLVEAGAAVAPLPLWPALVLGALPISEFGSDAQKERWLPGIASGDTIVTAGLAEQGTDDPLAPATQATREGDGWALTGTKICVPALHLAARVLVAARADSRTCLFLVDPKGAGVTLERQTATTGEPQFRMTLAGARVPEEDVLAGPEKGAEALAWLVDRATIGLCAMELGLTERAVRMTAEYTTGRQQFERPIATFQAVSQRAADAYIDVEAIRLSLWQAAFRLSEGLPAKAEISQAKYWAADAGFRVVYAAQHLHAGIGFDLDYPLHRYYLLSKQIELTLGSAATHLERLGAALAAG